eukprot:364496-Chlamydomonas_euryale.AAC.21
MAAYVRMNGLTAQGHPNWLNERACGFNGLCTFASTENFGQRVKVRSTSLVRLRKVYFLAAL